PLLVYIFIAFLGGVLSVLALGALLYTISQTAEYIVYAHALQWSSSRIFSLIWIVFFGLFLLVGASVLVVIPGLLIALYSVFTLLALMRENARGSHAFLRSYDLVQGA